MDSHRDRGCEADNMRKCQLQKHADGRHAEPSAFARSIPVATVVSVHPCPLRPSLLKVLHDHQYACLSKVTCASPIALPARTVNHRRLCLSLIHI